MSLPAGETEVNQGILTIKNLTPADSGLYECIATNLMGTKRARINVVVQQQKQGMLCFQTKNRSGKHSTLRCSYLRMSF